MIDSDVSINATPRNEFFTNYMSSGFNTIKMRNGGLTKIIDNGDVCFEMNNDIVLILRDVKRVLNIHLNLISVSKFDDKGY